jgi:kynurenine formamidase
MKKKALAFMAFILILACCAGSVSAAEQSESDLNKAWEIIQSKQFVDLTHDFEPGIPHWKGFSDEKRQISYTYKKDGFLVHLYTHVGQWGTHVDPPVHFVEGNRTIDQIDPKEMIMPFVVLDIHEQVEKNADYTVTPANLQPITISAI